MKFLKLAICMTVTVLILTTVSCNNINEPFDGEDYRSVTITAVAGTAAHSRAEDSTPNRFAISIWEDEGCTIAANVTVDKTNFTVSTDGTFSLPYLHVAKDYYCLFWADGGEEYYTLGSTLKNVTLAENKEISEAFQGKLILEKGRNATYSVTLTRAVGSLTLLETAKLPAGYSMSLTYSSPVAFNVANGMPTDESKEIKHTWTSTELDGSDSPATLKDDIFILAPVTEQTLMKLTCKCNDEEDIEISNVPFRANYRTIVKGHFTSLESVSFTVTHNTDWEDSQLAPQE